MIMPMPTSGQPHQLEIRSRLSAPRLARYERSSGGDVDAALDLYLWNARVSAAFFESLHLLEVGLRNTMHDELQNWVVQQSSSAAGLPWYVDPFVPLTRRARDKIAEARGRVRADGRAELPGRVVAELSFGFWWSLLAEHYNRHLWSPCLRFAFPGARRARLHGDLGTLLRLRNRIAHHEPVYGRDLAHDWQRLVDTTVRISPVYADWVRESSRVPAVLADRAP